MFEIRQSDAIMVVVPSAHTLLSQHFDIWPQPRFDFRIDAHSHEVDFESVPLGRIQTPDVICAPSSDGSTQNFLIVRSYS